jgi:hypothetical protein
MQQKNSAKKSQVTRKKARLSCKKIIDWQQKTMVVYRLRRMQCIT